MIFVKKVRNFFFKCVLFEFRKTSKRIITNQPPLRIVCRKRRFIKQQHSSTIARSSYASLESTSIASTATNLTLYIKKKKKVKFLYVITIFLLSRTRTRPKRFSVHYIALEIIACYYLSEIVSARLLSAIIVTLYTLSCAITGNDVVMTRARFVPNVYGCVVTGV